MNPSWLDSPAWARALALGERVAAPGDRQPWPEGGSNAELGQRRLQRWRSQPPFSDDALFAQRLARDGLDPERLAWLLGESAASLQQRLPEPAPWLQELAAAFARPASAYVSPEPGDEILGFLDAVQPLIDRACDRLQDGIDGLLQRWPRLPFDPATVQDVLLATVPELLLTQMERAMVLELNVARLQGVLAGDTAQERFQSFVLRLRQPDVALALLAEYPLLARQLVTSLARWAEVNLEFLSRLCADWPAICAAFSPAAAPGPLVELTGGAGDTHRGGRSVMIAIFESGLRIVYKPKSMAVDAHFQELLAWLNARGCDPPLRLLTLLDRGDYGWVEFIEHEGCRTQGEIERFYRRHGAYLALLYALNATDFHFENLIAAGEHPMLIDLETLFHPQLDAVTAVDADGLADQAMLGSVMQIGLLPMRLWSGEGYEGIDISGLSAVAGQLSPDRMPQLAGIGTDAMHVVRERVELPGSANLPDLDGVEISALDYVESIAGGFTHMARLLMAHRAGLLADDGPLASFAGDEIRVLLRPTRSYAQLLFESFHPDLLRDGLDRDRFFDRLWIAVTGRPYLDRVIAAEQAGLRQGDIPLFTTRPASQDLWGGLGEPIPDFLAEPGLALVQRRLQHLDKVDLQRQTWFIRASLATLAASQDRPAVPPYRLVESPAGVSRTRLIAAARSAADRLATLAIQGPGDATWIGLGPSGQENWDIMPLGSDLYGGVTGVALFLAYFGAVTREERYTTLARRALATTLRQADLLRDGLTAIGGFEGWGGILTTLLHLGVLWDEPALLVRADEVVERMAALVPQDESLDVVRGAAGAIGSLLAYHRTTGSSQALAAASACGDHLLGRSQPMARGIGWVIPGFGATPLAGFAHGAAGMAWALLELAAASGQARYRDAAQQSLAYERSVYSPDARNWPDLRDLDETASAANGDTAASEPRFMVAWCHGAAGIGLARLQALRHLQDGQLLDEVDAALHTTLERGFGQTHCLCHGDLGNLELLLQAGQALDDARWQAETRRVAAMAVDSLARDGWQCGGPAAAEMPSLMLGVAGIGYGLLRLAEPARVPSLLTLAPPG